MMKAALLRVVNTVKGLDEIEAIPPRGWARNAEKPFCPETTGQNQQRVPYAAFAGGAITVAKKKLVSNGCIFFVDRRARTGTSASRAPNPL
jgi:hypothetical protein